MKNLVIKVCLVLGLFLAALPAMAADVDGSWAGTMMGPQGDVAINFTFKADGETLTGTTTGPDGMTLPISDGKVNGDTISFSLAVDFGGMPFTINFNGKMVNGSIDLTMTMFDMPIQLTLKKS